MVKINRFKWCPFIVKEVVFEITNDKGDVYEQPMSNGWELEIEGNKINVRVNYENMGKKV